VRSPDQQGASTRFTVDADALSAAAAQLDRLSADLRGAIAGSRGPALDAVGAVPPSDLFNALAFCWGRWSRMLQDTQPALHSLAEATRASARSYAVVEGRLTAAKAVR
jgi:hypothetical protein